MQINTDPNSPYGLMQADQQRVAREKAQSDAQGKWPVPPPDTSYLQNFGPNTGPTMWEWAFTGRRGFILLAVGIALGLYLLASHRYR